jgi:hypothetical protein
MQIKLIKNKVTPIRSHVIIEKEKKKSKNTNLLPEPRGGVGHREL